MGRTIVAVLALAGAVVLDAQAADRFTVVTFPRANADAVAGAYVAPFGKSSGLRAEVATYDGETTELEKMVAAGKPFWDVIQVETRTLDRGCKSGLFEKIDRSRLTDVSDLVPGAVTECGVATFVWSQAFAYNADKIKGSPSSWADFWDVKKFPGKRALRRSAKYTLEIALLADGVAPGEIYKVLATKQGVDRAFRKLDEIKKDTLWWEAAQQPSLFLTSGRADMSSSYTLYIEALQKRGKNLRMVWNGSLYDMDRWAIPKGSPRVTDAYRFIAFASKAENQKAFVEELSYGPVNTKTLALLDPNLASALPTYPANLRQAIAVDIPFWIEHGAELEQRFAKWAPPLERQEVEEHDHDEEEAAQPGHTHDDTGAKPHKH